MCACAFQKLVVDERRLHSPLQAGSTAAGAKSWAPTASWCVRGLGSAVQAYAGIMHWAAQTKARPGQGLQHASTPVLCPAAGLGVVSPLFLNVCTNVCHRELNQCFQLAMEAVAAKTWTIMPAPHARRSIAILHDVGEPRILAFRVLQIRAPDGPCLVPVDCPNSNVVVTQL